jgi:hypothetical protein
MHKPVLVVVAASAIVFAVAQVDTAKSSPATKLTPVQGAQSSNSSSTPSLDSIGPQSFEGTWQGVWRGYGAVNHTETGSQSSLAVTLAVKVAGTGRLSGFTSTSPWQQQPIPTHNLRLSLGAPPPPVPPPPPPLPARPPSGKMLNPRTQERTLVFEVKDPDAKIVDFRLSLQGPNAATLDVTSPTHSRAYPEIQMKRMR